MNKHITSPFKFLNAYERADRELFFGREAEIEELYERVHESDLVLMYGTSGTGKTSLIQCGLANEFDPADWLPIFVYRKDQELMRAFHATLDQTAAAIGKSLDGAASISQKLKRLDQFYYKPIYLIFDQFEEVFTLGGSEEQQAFFDCLDEMIAEDAPVKIILSMREEYLGELYPFEEQVPSLFGRRIRVEAMGDRQAKEVIIQSCGIATYQIDLEEPEANAERIIELVRTEDKRISLPYLQVFLDQFYRHSYAQDYGEQPMLEDFPPLTFSTRAIQTFGDIGDILHNFLREQEDRIQKELSQAFPAAPQTAVRKVLGMFATLEGTKIPYKKTDLHIPALSEAALAFILQQLDDSRILRAHGELVELAHDTLALKIADQRDLAEQEILHNVELVQTRFRDFERTGTWLSEKELSLIADYEATLREEKRLRETEWTFIRNSEKEVKKASRNRNLRLAAVFALLLSFLLFAGWQLRQVSEAKDEAQVALLESYQKQKEAEQLKLNKISSSIETYKRADLSNIVKSYEQQRDSLQGVVGQLATTIDSLQSLLNP